MPKQKTVKPTNGSADALVITIPNIERAKVTAEIEGITSLIQNRFGAKAAKQIADGQTGDKGRAKKREARDPEQEYEEAKHRMPNGQPGVPSTAIKAAMIRAGKQVGLKMVDLRTYFHILDELCPLEGECVMRTDHVRLASGVTSLAYRPEYLPGWRATVTIQYDPELISPASLLHLLNRAGSGTGIGEWRPERGGNHGLFKVVMGDES